MLQIRTIYNFLCFCSAFACARSPPPQHIAPHLPRSSESDSASLSSGHRLTAKNLIFLTAPPVVLAFCFPCVTARYAPFSYQLPSLLSVSQPVLHLYFLLHLPMALLTLAKTATPPQWCGRRGAPVRKVTSSSFSSHFSKASFIGIAHCFYLHLFLLH